MTLHRTGNVTINQMAPALESISVEFPKAVPNPANGGAFQRMNNGPTVDIPATGNVATVNQSTGINTGTNTFTYTGNDPTNGMPYRVHSSGVIPTGLTEGELYYVRDLDTGAKTFKLAFTVGAAAVAISAAGSGTLTVTELYFDRLYPLAAKEDPAHGRLLMVAHARKPLASSDDNNWGRDIYLLSGQWGHPENPWTWLTPPTTPLIARGGAGNWKEGNVYIAAAEVQGNKLFIAYGGTDKGASALGHLRIGLATVNLDTLAVTDLTTAGPLQLGSSPYQGVPSGLDFWQGEWHLYVSTQIADGSVSKVPRHYTNFAFDTNVVTQTNMVATTGWRADSTHVEYGAYNGAGGSDTPLPSMVRMADGAMVGCRHYGAGSGYAELVSYVFGDKAIKSRNYALCVSPDSANGWGITHLDNQFLFYHCGQWYCFISNGNRQDATSAVNGYIGLGKWVPTATQDQTGYTPGKVLYPTELLLGASLGVNKAPDSSSISLATGQYGCRYDLSVRGKVTVNSDAQANLTDNPGFLVIEAANAVGVCASGYMRLGYDSGGDFAVGKFSAAIRYPTNSHTHTETGIETLAYPTAGVSGAVGPYIAAGLNISQGSWLIKGKTI